MLRIPTCALGEVARRPCLRYQAKMWHRKKARRKNPIDQVLEEAFGQLGPDAMRILTNAAIHGNQINFEAMRGVDLSGATLCGANLSGADLRSSGQEAILEKLKQSLGDYSGTASGGTRGRR